MISQSVGRHPVVIAVHAPSSLSWLALLEWNLLLVWSVWTEKIFFCFEPVAHAAWGSRSIEHLRFVPENGGSSINYWLPFAILCLLRIVEGLLVTVFFLEYFFPFGVSGQPWLGLVGDLQNIVFSGLILPERVNVWPDFLHFLLEFDLEIHIFNILERHSDRLSSRSFFSGWRQVVKQLERGWSFFGIELKAPIDYFSAFFTNLRLIGQPFLFDLFVDISHVLSIVESFTIQTFIKGDSQGPYLWFFTVFVIKEGLRRHVGGRSNVVFQTGLRIPSDLAISKINDLGLSVVQQNVGWLQVTVKNALSHQTRHSLQKLKEYLERPVFSQWTTNSDGTF